MTFLRIYNDRLIGQHISWELAIVSDMNDVESLGVGDDVAGDEGWRRHGESWGRRGLRKQ